MNELKRIYSRKVSLLFVMLVLLNFTLFMFSCDDNKDITLSGEELDSYIFSYGGFIEGIVGQSGSLSLLNLYDTGFGSRNIAKTAEDYGKLANITPVYGDNRSTVIFSDYHLTDIFLAAFLIIISTKLLDERRNGLAGLVRSTSGGRVKLYFSRIFTLMFSSVLGAACLYGGNIIGLQISYGSIGFGRPIQSVPEFKLCPYNITVGEYFAYSIAIKAAVCLTIAVAFFMLASLLGTAGSYLFGGAAAVSELLAYLLIPPVSGFNILKFVNVFSAVRADDYFRVYCNLNIFGAPVSIFKVSAIACLAVFIICFISGIFIHEKMYVAREHFTERLMLKIRRFIERHAMCRTLFGWEGYKLLVRQFAALIIAAVFAAALSQAMKYSYFYVIDPNALEWYDKYQGVINEEMLSRMEEDKAHLETTIELFQQQLDDIMSKDPVDSDAYYRVLDVLILTQAKYDALMPILDNVRDGVEYSSSTGREIMNIMPYSYDMLIVRDLKTVRRSSIFILIGIVAAVSGVYSFERQNHMELLLHSAYRGRRTVNLYKLVWIVLVCGFLALSVHLIQFNIIRSDMGLNDLDAPVQSLMFMRDFGPYISIKQYLILLFALRMSVACAVGLVCAAISRMSNDTSSSLGISAFTAALFCLAPAMIGISSGLIYWLGGEQIM